MHSENVVPCIEVYYSPCMNVNAIPYGGSLCSIRFFVAPCIVVYCFVLWCIAVYCRVLPCIAAYCGVLPRIVVYCRVLVEGLKAGTAQFDFRIL